jgi:hypothetical protein
VIKKAQFFSSVLKSQGVMKPDLSTSAASTSVASTSDVSLTRAEKLGKFLRDNRDVLKEDLKEKIYKSLEDSVLAALGETEK